jgi:hypothetical protein
VSARGNWVTMSTTVAGVKLMAIAYAWSAKGTSFFITTIGSTEVADEMYTTSFEDDYGVVGTVDIPRPSICSFLYKMLPTIDEHNRQGQHFLNLAASWPTKDCSVRIVGEMLGICVVDCKRLMQMQNIYSSMSIVQFADLLAGGLVERHSAVSPTSLAPSDALPLKHLTNDEGERSTKRFKGAGGRALSFQLACWECRGEYKAPVMTSFCCPYCNQSLCNRDRSATDSNRSSSCYKSHLADRSDRTSCQVPRPKQRPKSQPDLRSDKPPWAGPKK